MGGEAKPFVTFRADDRTWQVRLDSNAMCLAEQLTGRNASNWREGIGFADVRASLFAGMKKYHPKITLERVGELMDDMGFNQAVKVFLDAWEAAHGNLGEKDEGADDEKNAVTA
jgi:hypothetical protein